MNKKTGQLSSSGFRSTRFEWAQRYANLLHAIPALSGKKAYIGIIKTCLLITAVCYTKMDMKNGICWALCRQDGYDTGSFQTKSNVCICGNVKGFKEYTDKIIKVEPKKIEEDDPWDRFFR